MRFRPGALLLLLLSAAVISSSAVLASAPRSAAALGVVDVAPLSLTPGRDEASHYALFAGDELAQALAQDLRHHGASRFGLASTARTWALSSPRSRPARASCA